MNRSNNNINQRERLSREYRRRANNQVEFASRLRDLEMLNNQERQQGFQQRLERLERERLERERVETLEGNQRDRERERLERERLERLEANLLERARANIRAIETRQERAREERRAQRREERAREERQQRQPRNFGLPLQLNRNHKLINYESLRKNPKYKSILRFFTKNGVLRKNINYIDIASLAPLNFNKTLVFIDRGDGWKVYNYDSLSRYLNSSPNKRQREPHGMIPNNGMFGFKDLVKIPENLKKHMKQNFNSNSNSNRNTGQTSGTRNRISNLNSNLNRNRGQTSGTRNRISNLNSNLNRNRGQTSGTRNRTNNSNSNLNRNRGQTSGTRNGINNSNLNAYFNSNLNAMINSNLNAMINSSLNPENNSNRNTGQTYRSNNLNSNPIPGPPLQIGEHPRYLNSSSIPRPPLQIREHPR